MPRREQSPIELFNKESEELRRREHQLAATRDRAAHLLGLIVIEEGGASLGPDRLRTIVREAVASGASTRGHSPHERTARKPRTGVESMVPEAPKTEIGHVA